MKWEVGMRKLEKRRKAEVGKRDADLRTQFQITYEFGYVDEKIFSNLDERYARLAKMIGALITARKP